VPPSEGCQRTPCSTIQFKIVEEFLLGIGTGEDLGRRVMGAAHVAGVAGVAAAIEFRRTFQHQHGGAGAPGADRGTQRGIAAADHQHIVMVAQLHISKYRRCI
jgi:hypothetical protein